MQLEWPREVQRRADGVGVVYELPVRPLGALRWVGVFLCGFGVLFVAGPLANLIQQVTRLSRGDGTDTTDWAALVFMIPFIVAGIVPMAIGCFLVFGRCRIECRNRRVRVTESAGPFRWTRRLPDGPVRRLLVASAGGDSPDAPPPARFLTALSALVAYTDRPRPKLLVLGYPRPWLLAVAQELSALLDPLPGTAQAPVVEVQEAPLSRIATPADADVDVETPPAGTRVRMESSGGGLTIVVPPAGLRKGSHGLFFVALFWCGILSVITFAVFGWAGSGDSDRSGDVFGGLFILGFWLAGLGLVALSIHLGRRRALLVAERGSLRIAQASPFKTKQWTLYAADLREICLGPSGVEVNDRPVLELQFHPQAGKKLGLLAGRDVQELRWIATHLRRALGLVKPPRMDTEPPTAPAPPADPDAPPSHFTTT